tara:strand:+ start:544 stop:645 length:102 start_codon:yes stop_codon:yes gene_type:complete
MKKYLIIIAGWIGILITLGVYYISIASVIKIFK